MVLLAGHGARPLRPAARRPRAPLARPLSALRTARPGVPRAKAPTQPTPFAVVQSRMRITQRIKGDRAVTTALDPCLQYRSVLRPHPHPQAAAGPALNRGIVKT
jgi:hypothetical protein